VVAELAEVVEDDPARATHGAEHRTGSPREARALIEAERQAWLNEQAEAQSKFRASSAYLEASP
jgi:hypothetical protein